jgi:hypothetical protein
MKSKLLWRCSKCERQFDNTNQIHSCGRYTVKDFLNNRSVRAVELYRRFAQLVQECGPVVLAPAKTRVGFQVRMIFAAVNKLSERRMEAHVVLARRLENSRFTSIESISPRNHVHHFKIDSLRELDSEVKSWLEEAYRVGAQEHLRQSR